VFGVAGLDEGQLGDDYRNDGHDDLVFRGIAQVVYCKKESTPSRVRLIAGEQVFNLLRESLTRTIYATLEVSFGLREREVNVVSRKASKPRNVAGSKIKSGPQVFDCVNCQLCKGAWDRLKEFELVKFVSAARVRFDTNFAWCSLEVDIGAPYKIGKAFLCPLDT